MPAIDQARLEQQVADVVAAFDDPARLRHRVLDLLEFYASRVRPTSPAGRLGAVRSLGVPTPVMRAIENGWRPRAVSDRLAAAMAAETLWTAPVLEARLLAIALLREQSADQVPAWAEAWSHTAEDPVLLEALAGCLQTLHRVDKEGFWAALARYLATPRGPEIVLGLRALESCGEALWAEEIPRALELLAGMHPPTAGEAWRAHVATLRALAQRSPPETARFLVDEMERARPGAGRLARQLLEDFPPLEQEALRRSLRLTAPG